MLYRLFNLLVTLFILFLLIFSHFAHLATRSVEVPHSTQHRYEPSPVSHNFDGFNISTSVVFD